MLKDEILKLKEQKFTTGEIMKELGCSRNIIWYHFNPKKEEHRINSLRKNLTFKKFIQKRIIAFQTVGPNNREYKIKYNTEPFTINEFLNKFTETPLCGISGKSINLKLDFDWELDHIIPKKDGGNNSLSNCQIVYKEFNQMKGSLTKEQLVENCKLIIQYNE